jgi:hypothetical protein
VRWAPVRRNRRFGSRSRSLCVVELGYGAPRVAGAVSGAWYRNWYRSERTSPHLERLKRGRNPASVLKWTFRNRPSKPVRRGSPTLGRFDSCAAPYPRNCLYLSGFFHRLGYLAVCCLATNAGFGTGIWYRSEPHSRLSSGKGFPLLTGRFSRWRSARRQTASSSTPRLAPDQRSSVRSSQPILHAPDVHRLPVSQVFSRSEN